MRKVLRDFGLIFYEGDFVSIFRVAFIVSLVCFFSLCFVPSFSAYGHVVTVVGICCSACLGNKKLPNRFGGGDDERQ